MRWTLTPILQTLRGAVSGDFRPLEQLASKTWEIAPEEVRTAPPAFCLPGQFDRVTQLSPFASTLEEERRLLLGYASATHGATRALLLEDVVLADGVLYKGSARMHLHLRTRRVPPLVAEEEHRPSALYCSFSGNRYFGNWLIDDCAAYPLAREHGLPVGSSKAIAPSTQMLQYEALLDMRPHRCDQIWFKQLVVFQDIGQNSHKHRRFKSMGDKLLRGRSWVEHPGVFILRGRAGERRLLVNELQIAERLRLSRGFRILDPMNHSAAEIVEVCAGARAVVGVEGSQLVHGLMVLQPGGSLLTLQPPNRYCSLFKNLTDRDAQKFGIVVGTPVGDDFTIDPDEVERTLDLMEAGQPQAAALSTTRSTTVSSTLSSREDCTADTTPRVDTADARSRLNASISS